MQSPVMNRWSVITCWFLLLPILFLIACSGNSQTAPEVQTPTNQVEPDSAPLETAPAAEVTAAPTPGSGLVFTVDPNGSDENDGSQGSPWATIQHAVDNAAPGDTILLSSGTYAGARVENSGTAESWNTLAAAPGAAVLINAPGPNNKHESNLEFETWEGEEIVAYWRIDGLEVANAPNWGIDIRGSEEAHAHNFIISNNRVHDNGLVGGNTGIFTAFTDDVLVEGNESYNNGEHGIYLSNSGDRFQVRGNVLHNNINCGLHINGDLESGEDGIISDGLIENNRIYENGAEGCAGINLDGVTDTIIRNNLITQNHGSGIAIFQENGAVCSQNIQVLNNTILQAEDGRWAINISGDDCPNNKIFNNIILTAHDSRGSIVIPSPAIGGFESDYNVIMDRFSADDDNSVISLAEWQSLGYDQNSIIAAPSELFAGSDDFHLGTPSPAVDTGRDLLGVVADLEGTTRPQGSAYDIGAFENTGEAAVSTPAQENPGDISAAGGTITYTFEDHVYRIAAQEGAQPEDITLALSELSPGTSDELLNISPDGQWLVVETERFDPDCMGWACLALISADLTAGDAIRADGQVIHVEGYSAVASGGDLVLFSSSGDGPHELDLWAVSRSGDSWSAPLLLTADSPYPFNQQPAVSADGTKIIYNCSPGSYAGDEGALCEVGTDGTGFHIVLTPADAPPGFPTNGALLNPDYAPDGSILFEADWDGEQIWRLPAGSTEPVRVSAEFNNDNSPCVLPDGRIVSLWLNRPEGLGIHEIKVMMPDGSSYFMLLPDVDILDGGLGCAL